MSGRQLEVIFVLTVCTTVLDGVSAQGNGIDWQTAGVSWALSTATMLAMFATYLGIRRYLRTKQTSNHDPALFAKNIVQVERGASALEPNLYKPLVPSSTISSVHRPSSTSSTQASDPPQNRRKRDDVSVWCSDHGLPEDMAVALRERRFDSRKMLDALRPHDVTGLGLPNQALAVQLRRALETLHRQSSDIYMKSKRPSPNSISSANGSRNASRIYHRSNGELQNSYALSDVSSPTSISEFFPSDKSRSFDGLDAVDGRRAVKQSAKNCQPYRESPDNQLGFRGLLSNKGLYELTGMLGHEWRHLATQLNVPAKLQERLIENHPHATERAIFGMLQYWRDHASGNKEQIKGRLHRSLNKVGRVDIAEKLMQEQVDGSDCYMTRQVTSLC